MQELFAFLWSEHMDGMSLELPLSSVATFAGALVAGMSGFAFGLIAASIWLYILTPLQTASLIIAFGLIVQSYSVWKSRGALDWRRLWPFIFGAALGVPVGVTILTWGDAGHVRVGVGVFLVVYSLYALFRPAIEPLKSPGAIVDGVVGFLNGALGGIIGLAGILVTICCGLRASPKDVQRAVFQPRCGGDVPGECTVDRRQSRVERGDDQALSDRIASPVRRYLAWSQVVRPHPRGCLPQDRTGAASGFGRGPDRLVVAMDPAPRAARYLSCT